ncbi:NAD(P)-dependent oxidoreductase [Chitinophaga sp. sic0106]|uniref:NAD(P)-dependent oxidoreductase n=1 Tax=Chitinophaga sp. sic0106 TaxID=2854785 RepID=UPI001C462634|nr:NAD(P)-dependent oxidoreductase [Chitinophaga sp. sic0106]MBV7532517.1 NAD(P)-dependent oxidoreductase [Chitinophaga sp. sic0106]
MANIVIIGASGFVGSALVKEALSRGHQVKAVVRNPEKINIQNDHFSAVHGDVLNPGIVAEAVKGTDAVISAYNPGWNNPHIADDTVSGYKSILTGVKEAGIQRLLVVGGAGSLFVKPGVTIIDSGRLPPEILPGVKALAEVYEDLLLKEKDLDWVFFSPAGVMSPGERTGKYRLGKDDLILNDKGQSKISVEDYAAAMIDELEKPQHHRERFTIGY